MLLALTSVHFTCANSDQIDIFSSALNMCTVGPRVFVVGLASDVSSDTLPDTSWAATLGYPLPGSLSLLCQQQKKVALILILIN